LEVRECRLFDRKHQLVNHKNAETLAPKRD
jgi:hypothetical protein